MCDAGSAVVGGEGVTSSDVIEQALESYGEFIGFDEWEGWGTII